MKERKLKDEIIRFANSPVGTKIWVKEMGSWLIVEYARWLEDDVIYIVDDEFANLRKAEADGRILQFEHCDVTEKIKWNFVKLEELKFYTVKNERTFIDIYESDLQGNSTFEEFLDCKNAVHMEKDEVQFIRFYTENENKQHKEAINVDVPISTYDIELFDGIVGDNKTVKWSFMSNDPTIEEPIMITFMSEDEYKQRKI